MNKEDHDLLRQIANDIKHMVKWSDRHDLEDKERFESANKKIDWVTKVAYMGIGALVLIQFLVKIVQ